MNTLKAIHILDAWDNKDRYVYTKRDLSKILSETGDLLAQTLRRLVDQDILQRVARGAYIYARSRQISGYTIEEIAQALRRGEYNFLSLESILSEYGRISQIMIDRITVVTTGRSGEYETPYGVIEFTHTKADPQEILANTLWRKPHPLPIATEDYALRGLRKSRRNLGMLTEED